MWWTLLGLLGSFVCAQDGALQPTNSTSARSAAVLAANLPPFKTVFFINMDRDVDRRSTMEEQGRTLGLPLQRWRAVDLQGDYTAAFEPDRGLAQFVTTAGVGNLPMRKEASAAFPERLVLPSQTNIRIHDRTPFVWGCYLSHRTCYDHIEHLGDTSPDDLFLVAEDDVRFVPGWQQAFEEAYAHVPDDWEVLRIGYWGLLTDSDRVNEYVYRASQPSWQITDWGFHNMGTHGIVVRQRTLHKLTAFLDRQAKIDDLDIMITASEQGLKSYILQRQLVLCPYNDGIGPTNPAGMYGIIESMRSARKTALGV